MFVLPSEFLNKILFTAATKNQMINWTCCLFIYIFYIFTFVFIFLSFFLEKFILMTD